MELFVDTGYASIPVYGCLVSCAAILCRGAPITRISKTQKNVTSSTTEVEYVTMDNGVNTVIFVTGVLRFIFPDHHVSNRKVTVFKDDQGRGR